MINDQQIKAIEQNYVFYISFVCYLGRICKYRVFNLKY